MRFGLRTALGMLMAVSTLAVLAAHAYAPLPPGVESAAAVYRVTITHIREPEFGP